MFCVEFLGDKYYTNDCNFKWHIERGLSSPYSGGELEILKEVVPVRRKICIDVGGHIGTHAIPYSKLFETVYSFEVNPDNYKLMTENIRLNKRENIIAINTGISDVCKRVNLIKHGINSGCYTTHIDENGEFETIPLDTFFNDFEAHVDFIKIDVEGNELEVLEGAKNLIKKSKPVLQIEINGLSEKLHNVDQHKILAFLENHDYKIYKKLNSDIFFIPGNK